jgi:hypothetical protein
MRRQQSYLLDLNFTRFVLSLNFASYLIERQNVKEETQLVKILKASEPLSQISARPTMSASF